jgi:hypothetical protein
VDDNDVVHVKRPGNLPIYFYLWYYGTHEKSQTIQSDTIDDSPAKTLDLTSPSWLKAENEAQENLQSR